jgi:hypothetical protein
MYHIRWITNSFPGIKEASTVGYDEHETGEQEDVDDAEAAGGMIGTKHHHISTTPTPPIKTTTTTIKNFGGYTTEDGYNLWAGDEAEDWVKVGESDVLEKDNVESRRHGTRHNNEADKVQRWSRRLRYKVQRWSRRLRYKMQRRNVDGTCLITALKAVIKTIKQGLNTGYPDGPVKERDLLVTHYR